MSPFASLLEFSTSDQCTLYVSYIVEKLKFSWSARNSVNAFLLMLGSSGVAFRNKYDTANQFNFSTPILYTCRCTRFVSSPLLGLKSYADASTWHSKVKMTGLEEIRHSIHFGKIKTPSPSQVPKALHWLERIDSENWRSGFLFAAWSLSRETISEKRRAIGINFTHHAVEWPPTVAPAYDTVGGLKISSIVLFCVIGEPMCRSCGIEFPIRIVFKNLRQ